MFRPRLLSPVARWIKLSGATLLLVGCASAPPVDPLAACAALTGPIASSLIGLPSTGATITSATPVAASALSVGRGITPAGAVNPAVPAYFKVLRRIAPVDPPAPAILFP